MNMNLVFFTFHIIVITQNAIAQYCYISLQKAKLMIAHNNFIEKMEYLAISIKWGYMVSPPISKAP